jgi:predicted DNA-binding ribbon-helix-helix protein
MKPRRSPANVKRPIILDGRKTSLGLEDGFWNALKEIAAARETTVQKLILKIDHARMGNNRSSAVRLFVLDYYRRAASR